MQFENKIRTELTITKKKKNHNKQKVYIDEKLRVIFHNGVISKFVYVYF